MKPRPSTLNLSSTFTRCARHGWTFIDPWTGWCRTCAVSGGPRQVKR